MVASIISPSVVTKPEFVPTANYILSGFGIAAGLFGLTVRESKPPKPPSIGAAKAELIHRENAQSYLKHLKKILRNKNFMILTLAIGGGMGLVSAMQTMMAQILCPWGYDDDIAGLCCATMVLGGFIGAAVFSIIAEKTKRYEEIIKYGFSGAVLLTIVFTLLTRIRNITWALATVIGIMGFLAMGVYPVCLEAGVETTYPLDESFSSGMIVVAGQIQGVIFIPVMEALTQQLSYEDRQYAVCNNGSNSTEIDMTYSGLFLVGYAVILNCLLIIFFKPKYKRLEAEKEKSKEPESEEGVEQGNDIIKY
ncbi:Major facilitator super domain-containing protein 7 [Chamberlinius hualienensis]